MHLPTLQRTVLEALEDGNWRTPTEIQKLRDGLHVQHIRGALRELCALRLVERGSWGTSQHWGEYRATPAGVQLTAQRTLDQEAKTRMEAIDAA